MSVLSWTHSRCTHTSVENTAVTRPGNSGLSLLTAADADANTETTSAGGAAAISSRSFGTTNRLETCSIPRATGPPVRIWEKCTASYRPGTAIIARNTFSPADPARPPIIRRLSTVRVEKPRPLSDVRARHRHDLMTHTQRA